MMDRPPWADVPAALGVDLRAVLPMAIEDVITSVTGAVPAYSVQVGEAAQSVLVDGVRVALERLLDLLGTTQAALGPAAGVYEQIGMGEYRSGRPLEDVLAAYRVGALATWRSFSAAAVAANAPPDVLAVLAEACFAYINEISAASAAGYATAQSRDAGIQQQRRRDVVARIVGGEGSSPAVTEAAHVIAWPLPGVVVVAVLDGVGADPPGWISAALPVAGTSATENIAIGPVPRAGMSGQYARRWWPTRTASLGTEVRIAEAPVSLRHARLLHANRGRAGIPEAGPALSDDHLAALILASDPALTQRLRDHVLRPLEDVDPERAHMLSLTLRSWLFHEGSRAAVAADLHVHPQTVSYRMERIRQLFGRALADPHKRWELRMALMASDPI